jgi:hypothetical protein
MQQQVRRDPLEKPFGLDQLNRTRIAVDRQPTKHPRNQPHRALPDGIAPVNLIDLLRVGRSEPHLR